MFNHGVVSMSVPNTTTRIATFLALTLRLRSIWVTGMLLLILGSLNGCGLMQKDDPDPRSSVKGQAVLKTAYTQMGKRYRLGGESPRQGFDCSGLIWWAYQKHGVEVPRITSDQAKAGRSVPKHKAAPGDIVVFRTSQAPRGLHTGIYAGGNTFIHSPRKGERVRVESMEVPYWKNKLTSVRRVVN